MEEMQGIDQIRAWLKKRKPELPELDLDLDLIENRVIDSLMFVDFLFFLEELTGRDLEGVRTTHQFRTLRSIRDHVLLADA
jgi:acyl carrier protein